MEGLFNNREKRSHPRVIINLPIQYRDMGNSCLRGGIVVNASERGFLIETVRDIPVGLELSIAVLFPKGFELTDFKVVAKIVRKELYYKEDMKGNQCWKGYQYGFEFIEMLEEDRWKQDFLLTGR